MLFGSAALTLGRTAEAVAALTRATTTNPQDVDGQVALAEALLGEGRATDALGRLRSAGPGVSKTTAGRLRRSARQGRRAGLVAQERLEEALGRRGQRDGDDKRQPGEERRLEALREERRYRQNAAMLKAQRREQDVGAAPRLAQKHRAAEREADDGGHEGGDGLKVHEGAILAQRSAGRA